MSRSRTEQRIGMDVEVRIRLLEADMDHYEHAGEAINRRLDKMMGILTGVLVALTTSSILLAVNLLVSQ
jgi:hypothetical protein